MKSGLWLITLGCFTLLPLPSHAQLIPDNSLGAENSQINPNVTINGNPATQIEGGATRGSNLFHSFQDFNVNLGQQVYFANPADIANIFTRVTGNNPSNILGTLGVDGAANLFLLNPNGIIFGESAQLDIRGSFVASTADSILFNNGIEFSATNPQAPPLLTVNVPLGLQRGNSNATITNRGNLSVGGNFTFDATNLNLQGQLHAGDNLALQATDTLTIRDTESNPFLATAYGSLVVQGNQTVDIFALNHADSGFYSYGDMTFRSDNPVGGDAHYWSGGNFRIERLDGSVGDLYSPYDPIIVVDGNVDITNYTGASLHILATGSVNVGSATITGSDPSPFAISKNHINPAIAALATVALPDGTTYDVDGQNRPTLDIRSGIDPATVNNLQTVLNALNPAPPPRAFYPLPPIPGTVTNLTGPGFNAPANLPNVSVGNLQINSPGRSGDIIITSTRGIGLDNSVLNTGLSGTNDGNIILSGANGINLINGNAQINANNNLKVYGHINGNANDLSLTAGNNILVNDTVNLRSATVDGGNFNVTAGNNLTINQGIDTGSDGGNAGNISLTSNNGTTEINNLLAISTAGDGGNVTVSSNNGLEINNLIDTRSAVGNSGDINLISNNGTAIINNDLLVTSTTGNSGDVFVNANNGITVNRDINTSSTGGDAGDISLTSNNGTTEINNLLAISTAGDGGNVTVSSNNGLEINNLIDTRSAVGNSGDINLISNNGTAIINNDLLVTSTTGNSGDVFVNANNGITVNRDINTASLSGDGGDINLVSSTGGVSIKNDLTTSSLARNSGNVIINALTGVLNSGEIDTSSVFGNAGNVEIWSGNYIISGGDITANSPLGNGGNILAVGNGNLYFLNEINTESRLLNPGNISVSSLQGNIELFQSRLRTLSYGFGSSGAVQLNALLGEITLKNNSEIITTTRGLGDAGLIDIRARDFQVLNQSGLYAVTDNSGNAGTINLDIANSINFDRGFAFANTFQGTGNAGRIVVNANQLTAQNGSLFSVSSQGQGDGGSMLINARNSMTLTGNDESIISATNKVSSTAFSLGSFGGSGAGNLEINTSRLVVKDGALIYGSVDRNSAGNAANMTIRASDSVQVIGTTPNNQLQSSISSDTFGAGNAGNLQIFTPTLSVLNGGKISAGTTGTGRAGTLSVNDANMVEVKGTSANGQLISTIVYDSFGAGDAGELTINSQRVMVQNGGRISARTGGLGRGGAINVNAPDAVEISGRSPNGQASGLFFNSESSGDARGINVNTGVLRLSDGGQLNVGGSGAGTAGDIQVKATSIFMNNGSRITAETSANGGGGNIRLEVADIIWLRHDSDIRTDARGAGLGGNIDITAEAVLAILGENSDVIARSELNQGGRITVNAKLVTNFRLYQDIDTPESDLTANSVFGVDGTVDLFTNDLQLETGLPESPRDVQIRQNCEVAEGANISPVASAELYDTRRGGMTPNPGSPLSSGGMSVPFAQSFTNVAENNSNDMVEAGGLVRLPNGEVILASSELLGEIDLSLACTQR